MKEDFLSPPGLYYKINQFQAGRETLVFMHGLSGSSSAWWEYEKIFSADYNLVLFDLRGHGKSKKFKDYEAYEIKKSSADLQSLVEHLHLDKFVLISHSFGSLIALQYILDHQEMLKGAVLLSPSMSVSKRPLSRLLKPLLWLVRSCHLFPYSPKPGGQIDYAKHPQSGDWDLSAVSKDVKNTSLRVYLYCTEQSLAVDFENRIGDISIPLLLVHGKKDTIFPVENALAMKSRLKNATLLIIDKADHIIARNNVPEVSNAMKEFFRAIF